VGNPPFMGGKRITGPLGSDYREHMVRWIAGDTRGNADLAAYFVLRAGQVVRRQGIVSLLATNTIAQGDTREVGLDRMVAGGWSIGRAVKSRPWPGGANLEISEIWLWKGRWQGRPWLDGTTVVAITTSLDARGRTDGPSYRLMENTGKAFQGSNVVGLGFMMPPQEARDLIQRDPRNADVLFPYLNGEDLNNSPDQSPSRWVINFSDLPLEAAADYSDCLAIVRERVKPNRDRNNDRRAREFWWQPLRPAPQLHQAIAGMSRVLVLALTSKTVAPTFVSGGWVYSHALGVFASDNNWDLSLLSSAVHYWWALARTSTMRTDLRYTLTDCFETLPQPTHFGEMAVAGGVLDAHRRHLMLAREEGLTKTYNRVHSPAERGEDIVRLRELHVELDSAVTRAYGWRGLDLDHGFHDTRQGVRFTIGPAARVEVLDRLLELNHDRYAAEVERGLHDPRKGRAAQLTIEGL
jgi:hypothetical protein